MRRKAQVTVEVKPEPKVKVSPEMLTDNRRFKELGENIAGNDPLDFPGYEEKIEAACEESGKNEAVTVGFGKIDGRLTAIALGHNCLDSCHHCNFPYHLTIRHESEDESTENA